MSKIILYLLFALVVRFGYAQQEQHYLFSNITTKNGLSSNHVNSIVQDDLGYLWIGTLNGLQRYDGKRFISFYHNPYDPATIPDNHIRFLFYDQKKRLWASFDNGKMGIFDTRKLTFREVNIQVNNEHILTGERGMKEDAAGNLFLYFNFHQLTTYNESKNEFATAHNSIPTPPGWKITGMHIDKAANKYWMGFDSGLCVYNGQTKHLNYLHHNIDKDPAITAFASEKAVYSLMMDSKQRLWFFNWPPGKGSQAFCFDYRRQAPLLNAVGLGNTFNYYHEPRIFHEHRDGSLWVYGTGMIGLFNEKTTSFQNIGNEAGLLKAILNDQMDYVFEDRENNLWICTSNNGIYQFNPSIQLFRSFGHPNPLNNEPGNGGVMSFLEEENNSLLYSAWGDGLFRCDSNFKRIPLGINGIPERNLVTAWDMCKRRDGKIWMGLQDGLVIIYDPVLKSAKTHRPPLLEGRTIRQVVEDRQGNMWLGSQSRGVFKWVKGKADINQGFSKFTAIPQTLVEKLYIDRQGNLWICTIVDGVYKVDTETGAILEHYTHKGETGKRLLNKGVGDVMQYDDTTIIIAAGGLNILNTNTNRFQYMSSYDGLPSNIINSIEKDSDGELWISFLMGLCRVNLQQRTFSFFDRNDGIANDNFSLAASLRLSNGNILFGTGNDFVVLNPRNFKTKTAPPDVKVTGFHLSNVPLLTDSLLSLEKIVLDYNDNAINILFASLSYQQCNKLIYYYMMEGIDKEWVKAGSDQQAAYSHLPPGNYTFKVKCQNPDGVPGKNITQLHISVSPPFWKSWWFYSLLTLLGAYLLYRLDKERMQRKGALQKMRSDIAGNLHEEVNMALNNINILSEMARIKADKEPAKSIEYLEQIHSKSNDMIFAMEDMLWSLSPENDSMQKTVERMQEYIDELKNNYKIDITMTVDKKVAALELNMKLRYEALLVFKEGIKNLVQCGTRFCDIQIGLAKNNLLFTMQFQNSFCNIPQLHQLLHRYDLEKHLQTIGAKVEIDVHKTNSILVLHIPVQQGAS